MKLYLVERDWDKYSWDELCSFVGIVENKLDLNKLITNIDADCSDYSHKEL